MQNSNAPARLPTPFALSGDKNLIPQAAAGVPAGRASMEQGFPPLTRTPIAAGGIPPFGRDFNGILNALSQVARWANAGGGYTYDATFAADANVGGYPKGALLLKADLSGFWFNTVENNTTNPDSGGSAGWQDLFAGYLTNAAAASAYAPVHGNVSAFVNDAGYLSVADFPHLLASSGYQKLPGGLILQWCSGTPPSTGYNTYWSVTFPFTFPNACLAAVNSDANYAFGAHEAGNRLVSLSTTGATYRLDGVGDGTGPTQYPTSTVFAIGY